MDQWLWLASTGHSNIWGMAGLFAYIAGAIVAMLGVELTALTGARTRVA